MTESEPDKVVYPDLPGWAFYIQEVAQGAFEVIGKDELGNSVRVLGPDEDRAIEDCKNKAKNYLKFQSD